MSDVFYRLFDLFANMYFNVDNIFTVKRLKSPTSVLKCTQRLTLNSAQDRFRENSGPSLLSNKYYTTNYIQYTQHETLRQTWNVSNRNFYLKKISSLILIRRLHTTCIQC